MADRTVRVKLSAQVQEYIAGMEQAAQKTRETSSEAQQLTQRRADFQALGTALVTFGGVVTAIGVAAAKTGIEYNTMQQTTRAALTTLLGSATAANAQMDKLDEFARNSPFAKQVFIRAQQQMLGFGVAAKDVIPALDAIQNAVAAMGGSNEQIAAISEIMARIKSESRLSGDAMQRLGYYGIDAAAIIGSRMGKTAAEIRDMARKPGGIPVEEIWQPLVDGMQKKFGGAAENVKNTFEGAVDRVKAAWRDFSSELAKPLVDPDGGGGLVDLLNWTADAMRNFEKLPEPVKATVTALTGLVGVGSLVAGSAILAIPKWVEFRGALDALRITGGSVRDRLGGIVRFLGGPWGIAMAAATISVIAFNNAMNESKASARDFEIGIKQGSNALDVMRETAAKNEQGLVTAFVNVGQHIEDLPALLNKAETSGRGFFSSLSFNEQAALDNLSALGDELARIAATDLGSAQGEFVAFADAAGLTRREAGLALDEMPEFKKALLDAADAAGAATDDASLLAYALGGDLVPAADDASGAADDSAKSLEALQGVAKDTTEAVEDLADEIRNFGSAQFDTEKATIQFYDALDDLTENLNSGSASLDVTTEAGRETRGALLDAASATNDLAAATLSQTGSQEAANAVLEQGRERLIETMVQLGWNEDAARAYADQLIATPEAVTTAVQLSGVDQAERDLAWVARRREALIDIKTNGGAGSGALNFNPFGSANGNLFAYADGGISEYANGGITTGIYSGGTPLYKFAEPETGWEAFISGKAGQEARNRQIWVEAGSRLGMGDVMKAAAAMASAGSSSGGGLAPGDRLVIEVEGTPLTAIAKRVLREDVPSRQQLQSQFGT